MRPPDLPALVTDAHSRAGVATLRALGAAGIEAWALGDRRSAPGLWSRHARVRLLGPSSRDAAAWRAHLAALAAERGPYVVLPGQEEAAGALLDDPPPGVVLPYGDPAAVRAVRDKGVLAELGERAGLPAPRTLAAGTAADVLADPPAGAVAVKPPAISDDLPATVLCDGADELLEVLAALPPDHPVLVQERVEGRLVAVSLVLDATGRVVARLQQVALRLSPARAGASSLAVTVAPDDALVERVAELLRAARFSGLAQVQLLEGAHGLRVIDVNPRPYGSLPLALAAGVNLVAAWHAVAVGRELPPPGPYRAGVTYRWFEGDLTVALRGGQRHRLRRRAPAPRAGAMWDAGDPLASGLLAADWLRPVVERRLLRRGAG